MATRVTCELRHCCSRSLTTLCTGVVQVWYIRVRHLTPSILYVTVYILELPHNWSITGEQIDVMR